MTDFRQLVSKSTAGMRRPSRGMRRHTLALLLSLAVLPSQAQEQLSGSSLLSGALRKSGLPGNEERVTIPLNATFAGFAAKVKIDGKPVQLILDTGATATCLSPEAAKRVGLKAFANNGIIRGLSGARLEAQCALTKRIALGDAWTVNEPVVITEMPGVLLDGVLGIGTLADWDVRINPAEKILMLFGSGRARPWVTKLCCG